MVKGKYIGESNQIKLKFVQRAKFVNSNSEAIEIVDAYIAMRLLKLRTTVHVLMIANKFEYKLYVVIKNGRF